MFTSVTALKRRPITMPIYSNLAPNLGIFSDQPQHLWYYKPENNPVFYKKGGKIIKAHKNIFFKVRRQRNTNFERKHYCAWNVQSNNMKKIWNMHYIKI